MAAETGKCCMEYPIDIRKYGSISYVGMGRVQIGILYLRYRSDLVIMKAEHCKAFTQKTLYYSIVENAPRLLLVFLKVAKTTHTNIHFALLVLSFFLCISSCITQEL